MAHKIISSRSNAEIVRVASLKEKKYREKHRLFCAEGRKLFSEAVDSPFAEIQCVYCTSDNYGYCEAHAGGAEVVEVSDEVYSKLSVEKAPQGVICVIKYIDKLHDFITMYNGADENEGALPRTLVLSEVRDPGNLGTVIRTAAAFGVEYVILSSDCADIYNPRVVRAAMGTLFSQRITMVSDMPGTLERLGEVGYTTYASVLDERAVKLSSLTLDRRSVFIIGNEGHGLSSEIVRRAHNTVYIPMTERAESLNAATAASVMLWEAFRQTQA